MISIAGEEACEWLRYARRDAALARVDPQGVQAELLCFHAQQSAEKAIKGVLVNAGVSFPRIHDIDRLLEILIENGLPFPAEVGQAGELTGYAIHSRYPFFREPISAEDVAHAIARADVAPVGRGADPACRQP